MHRKITRAIKNYNLSDNKDDNKLYVSVKYRGVLCQVSVKVILDKKQIIYLHNWYVNVKHGVDDSLHTVITYLKNKKPHKYYFNALPKQCRSDPYPASTHWLYESD